MPAYVTTVKAMNDRQVYLGPGSDGDYCVFSSDDYDAEVEIGDRLRGFFDDDGDPSLPAHNITKDIAVHVSYESWGCSYTAAMELLGKLGSPTKIFT